MAKGKKTDTETIYKIMVSMFSTNNFSETGRQLGLSHKTVEKIYKENKDKPEFTKLCQEKREEFVEKATRIIDKAGTLLERRLTTALEKQDELDVMIDTVWDLDNKDADYKKKVALANKIGDLQLNRISEITTALGTMFDKRALAKGDSTTNTTITVTMSDEVKRLAE